MTLFHLSNLLIPNIVPWVVGLQRMNLGQDTIQSIAPALCWLHGKLIVNKLKYFKKVNGAQKIGHMDY